MAGRHVDMKIHIGRTYNYLDVLSLDTDKYVYKGKEIKRTYFNCKCICGSIKRILAGAVLNETTKSCGCQKTRLVKLAINTWYNREDRFTIEKSMFSSYKRHGKNFHLTLKQFIELINQRCNYCGSEPTKERFSKNKKISGKFNGIDRIDNSLGYLITNCVPCCTICNSMKNVLSEEDFKAHIVKIYEHNKGRA